MKKLQCDVTDKQTFMTDKQTFVTDRQTLSVYHDARSERRILPQI